MIRGDSRGCWNSRFRGHTATQTCGRGSPTESGERDIGKLPPDGLSACLCNPLWWAYRITVQKTGRQLDVDNVAKTIVDAFCTAQIARDGSSYLGLGLYPDDTFDFVRVLQVIGSRSTDGDRTTIEIFACVNE